MHELKSRYPNFTNPESFVNLCDQLQNSGDISEDDNLLLKRFHYGIVHKLTSAVYSLEGIRRIVSTGSHIPRLTTTSGAVITQIEFDDKFQIGYFQDNFFNSLIGSLDILSLKLNLIHNNPISDLRNCYFSSLVNALVQRNATGTIESYLNGVRSSSWYQDTHPFRICLTHRQQLDCEIHIEVVAGASTMKHYLPDDPLAIPYTYNNHREIVSFCEDKMNHFINTINEVDGLLIKETQRIGHIPF